MTFPIEIEAAALAQTLHRMEPDITAEEFDGLGLLARLLTASIAGVENATDAHWVLVGKMLRALSGPKESTCLGSIDDLLSADAKATLAADLADMARKRRQAAASAADWPMA
jgi:hypothetical protein